MKPSKIIADAMELFTHDARGNKVAKPRWNNHTLVTYNTADGAEETYCALGAMRKVTFGSGNTEPFGKHEAAYMDATNIVASCIPQRIRR